MQFRLQGVEPGVSYIREFETVVVLTEVCALSLLTFLLHICASLRLKYTKAADESYSNRSSEIFVYIFSCFPKVCGIFYRSHQLCWCASVVL